MAKGPVKEAQSKIGNFQLNTDFNGYVARKDKTKVGPNFLVAPSQNVMIGTSGRPASVKGYTLDGTSSTAIDSGIRSNFDFDKILDANIAKLKARYGEKFSVEAAINRNTEREMEALGYETSKEEKKSKKKKK